MKDILQDVVAKTHALGFLVCFPGPLTVSVSPSCTAAQLERSVHSSADDRGLGDAGVLSSVSSVICDRRCSC